VATKTLIVTGLYRHIRNPIYVGALLVQLGTIIWHVSIWLTLYFLSFIIAFHILIVFVEELVLQKMFGAGYNEYAKRVPRWIPGISVSDPKYRVPHS
jgi:protein-S-isoprenylcysteine O-methyltransferase Ste14